MMRSENRTRRIPGDRYDPVEGVLGALRPLVRAFLEAALNGYLEASSEFIASEDNGVQTEYQVLSTCR